MKKILKNGIAVMLMLLLVCTVAFVASPEVAAADPGTTVSNPIILTPDVFYTRYWTEDNDHLNCYCKIEVPSRGYITFTIIKPLDSEGEVSGFDLKLYDPEGEVIWNADTEAMEDTFSDSYVFKIGLEAGTYYMNFDPYFYVTSGSIPATFKYSFTENKYWEIEPNGNQTQALPIELGVMYGGTFCEESVHTTYSDYFAVELKANKKYVVKIDNYAKMESGTAMFKVINQNGEEKLYNDYNKNKQEGSVYIWEYTPVVTGIHYVVMYNEFGEIPVDYKLGVFEYVCKHRPASSATCSTKAICADCGEWYGDYNKSNHSTTTLKAVSTTCSKEGKTAGKKCTLCGKVTVAQKTVAKKSHTYKTTTTKATLKKNGKQVTKCTACGKVSKSTTIYYPKSIKLSATSYTYNGKAKTPSVTVKDSKGKTLKKDTDYTVKYASGRKNPGKYTVTINFKGKYSGTKKFSFTIKPATVTLSKVTAGSKQLTAAWKTVSGATGYEVQASTSKKFTSKTTKKVTIKKAKSTKTTIKKLTKGKSYFVKVRAYKTVDGKKVYGAWSSVKSVKVK